jgi:hypothetical protein
MLTWPFLQAMRSKGFAYSLAETSFNPFHCPTARPFQRSGPRPRLSPGRPRGVAMRTDWGQQRAHSTSGP